MPGVLTLRFGNSVELVLPNVPLLTGDPQSVIRQWMLSRVQRVLDVMTQHIVAASPVGVTGSLAGSWRPELLETAEAEVSGRVFSTLPYAIVLDQGRRPGATMPPPDALIPWVRGVLGITDAREVESTAWAVAISIARKGIRGRQYVQQGIDRAQSDIDRAWSELEQLVAEALVT